MNTIYIFVRCVRRVRHIIYNTLKKIYLNMSADKFPIIFNLLFIHYLHIVYISTLINL